MSNFDFYFTVFTAIYFTISATVWIIYTSQACYKFIIGVDTKSAINIFNKNAYKFEIDEFVMFAVLAPITVWLGILMLASMTIKTKGLILIPIAVIIVFILSIILARNIYKRIHHENHSKR